LKSIQNVRFQYDYAILIQIEVRMPEFKLADDEDHQMAIASEVFLVAAILVRIPKITQDFQYFRIAIG
jgi:hypothetical protein